MKGGLNECPLNEGQKEIGPTIIKGGKNVTLHLKS